MHITQSKEQFSAAYAHAVASVAGYNLYRCMVDDDSLDIGICGNRSDGSKVKAPKLDIQLKCTEIDTSTASTFAHSLKIKNYDDLRDSDVHVPRILVVLHVPPSMNDWLSHADEYTILRRSAYWMSLRGLQPISNETTKTVHLPKNQRFTVDELRSIMKRIGDGNLP